MLDSAISADGKGTDKEIKIPRSRSVRKLTSRIARDDILNKVTVTAQLKPCRFTGDTATPELPYPRKWWVRDDKNLQVP